MRCKQCNGLLYHPLWGIPHVCPPSSICEKKESSPSDSLTHALDNTSTKNVNTLEQAQRMCQWLSEVIDEHWQECKSCIIEDTTHVCIFCKQASQLMQLKVKWMEVVRCVKEEKKA